MLVLYVCQKASGLRNVLMLSTEHERNRVTKDQQKLPQIIVYYNHGKGGVDVTDYYSAFITTR